MIFSFFFILIGLILQVIAYTGSLLNFLIPQAMTDAINAFFLNTIQVNGYIDVATVLTIIGYYLGFMYYFLLWKLFRWLLHHVPGLRHDHTAQLIPDHTTPEQNELDLRRRYIPTPGPLNNRIDLRGIRAGKGVRSRKGNTRDIL